MKTRLFALALLLATSAALQAQQADWPQPDLSTAAAPVREAIDAVQQRMRNLLGKEDDPITLANAWMALGDVYLAHEYQTEARAAYARAVERQPERSDLQYRLALISILQGDDETALAALDRALALPHPDVIVPGRVRRGQILLERGRNDDALADFERALALQPEHPAALEGQGRALLALGRPEAAIEPLRRALELDPGASRIYTLLGNAFRASGKPDAARQAFALAGDGEPLLLDPVLAQIQVLSRSPQFFLESGLAQADRGDFVRAAELIGRALSLVPEDLKMLSTYAQVLVEAEQDELARAAFERLEQAGVISAMDRAYLARIEARAGALDRAEQTYAQALAADPELVLAREGRARVWLAQGRYRAAAGAFAELAESVAEPSRRASFEYWLGLARLGDGNCAGAMAALDAAAARVERPGAALLDARIRARATCPEVAAELRAEALEWAEMLYDARPGLESSATLAMAYAGVGRFDDAVDLQAQAIFEALKDGTLESRPELTANMQRYQQQLPAARAFGPDDPVWTLR